MDNKHIFKGRIEVICGSMFSGKTEELIRRIKKVELADEKYIIFRPKIDSIKLFHMQKTKFLHQLFQALKKYSI